LSHLNGKTVSIIADGIMRTPAIVSGGVVAISGAAASYITVGLPYVGQLQTMRLDIGEGQGGTIQGKRKKVNAVTVRAQDTLGLYAGQSFSTLTPMKDFAVGTSLITGDGRTLIAPNWDPQGQVCIQTTPGLPASILGVIPEITVGDT